VQFAVQNVASDPIRGTFSVIVLSEVLYYLGFGARRRAICDRFVDALATGGFIVATNPWPAAIGIERWLGLHPDLGLVDRRIYPEPGRAYALSIYGRRDLTNG